MSRMAFVGVIVLAALMAVGWGALGMGTDVAAQAPAEVGQSTSPDADAMRQLVDELEAVHVDRIRLQPSPDTGREPYGAFRPKLDAIEDVQITPDALPSPPNGGGTTTEAEIDGWATAIARDLTTWDRLLTALDGPATEAERYLNEKLPSPESTVRLTKRIDAMVQGIRDVPEFMHTAEDLKRQEASVESANLAVNGTASALPVANAFPQTEGYASKDDQSGRPADPVKNVDRLRTLHLRIEILRRIKLVQAQVAVADSRRADDEKTKADEEKARADYEKTRADYEKKRKAMLELSAEMEDETLDQRNERTSDLNVASENFRNASSELHDHLAKEFNSAAKAAIDRVPRPDGNNTDADKSGLTDRIDAFIKEWKGARP